MILTKKQTDFLVKVGFTIYQQYLPKSNVSTIVLKKEDTTIEVYGITDIHFNRDSTMLVIRGKGTAYIHEGGSIDFQIYSTNL